MKAAVKRKMNQDGQPITTRLLHVLKDEFIGKTYFADFWATLT
jgi:hypothetical protein